MDGEVSHSDLTKREAVRTGQYSKSGRVGHDGNIMPEAQPTGSEGVWGRLLGGSDSRDRSGSGDVSCRRDTASPQSCPTSGHVSSPAPAPPRRQTPRRRASRCRLGRSHASGRWMRTEPRLSLLHRPPLHMRMSPPMIICMDGGHSDAAPMPASAAVPTAPLNRMFQEAKLFVPSQSAAVRPRLVPLLAADCRRCLVAPPDSH